MEKTIGILPDFLEGEGGPREVGVFSIFLGVMALPLIHLNCLKMLAIFSSSLPTTECEPHQGQLE
jgi:hypothetical protein